MQDDRSESSKPGVTGRQSGFDTPFKRDNRTGAGASMDRTSPYRTSTYGLPEDRTSGSQTDADASGNGQARYGTSGYGQSGADTPDYSWIRYGRTGYRGTGYDLFGNGSSSDAGDSDPGGVVLSPTGADNVVARQSPAPGHVDVYSAGEVSSGPAVRTVKTTLGAGVKVKLGFFEAYVTYERKITS